MIAAVLAGLHTGTGEWALVNVTPKDARCEIFGVWASGWPPSGSTQSLRSSATMNSTFGDIATQLILVKIVLRMRNIVYRFINSH